MRIMAFGKKLSGDLLFEAMNEQQLLYCVL